MICCPKCREEIHNEARFLEGARVEHWGYNKKAVKVAWLGCENCGYSFGITDESYDKSKAIVGLEEKTSEELKEEIRAPHGRCEKCKAPLRMELDGADADGNRGRWVYYCTNENCEECP